MPKSDKLYLHRFPRLSYRDIVRMLDLLRRHLGLSRIHTLIGASIGGQMAIEWAIMRPKIFEHLVLIACNARQSAWNIAFNETQRMAIGLDATWRPKELYEADSEDGLSGMAVARTVALLSYRHPMIYAKKQDVHADHGHDHFPASNYQRYMAKKFRKRFNAYSYWLLSKASDAHSVGRGRGGTKKALQKIRARTLIVGIREDLLFPLFEQEYLHHNIAHSKFSVLSSPYGHDAFLVETKCLSHRLRQFYRKP